MKIVSFYSDSPGQHIYRRYAEILTQDLQRLNMPFCIEEFKYQGSWVSTCRAKPRWILEKLQQEKNPICWLDIDSRIHKAFPNLSNLDFDVAAPESKIGKIGTMNFTVESAMIFFNYTTAAESFLERWKDKCEQSNCPTGDHSHFLSVWDKMIGVKTVRLPSYFCSRTPGNNIATLTTSDVSVHGKSEEVEKVKYFLRNDLRSMKPLRKIFI